MDNKQSITIVTAFFDLGRSKWQFFRRDIREYFLNAKINLSLDQNYIIFIEPEYLFMVNILREKFMNKTYIVPTKKTDLPKYSLRTQIREVMDSTDFNQGIVYPKAPEMWNPDYEIVTWSKTDLLKKAIEIDPFGTTHFCWLDFGLGPYAQIQNFPKRFSNKLRLLCLSEPQEKDLDRRRMCKSHCVRFAGGFLTGPKELLLWFSEKVDEEIEKCLNLNVVDCEQTMWSNTYLQHKEKFDLYYGNWEKIIVGY